MITTWRYLSLVLVSLFVLTSYDLHSSSKLLISSVSISSPRYPQTKLQHGMWHAGPGRATSFQAMAGWPVTSTMMTHHISVTGSGRRIDPSAHRPPLSSADNDDFSGRDGPSWCQREGINGKGKSPTMVPRITHSVGIAFHVRIHKLRCCRGWRHRQLHRCPVSEGESFRDRQGCGRAYPPGMSIHPSQTVHDMLSKLHSSTMKIRAAIPPSKAMRT